MLGFLQNNPYFSQEEKSQDVVLVFLKLNKMFFGFLDFIFISIVELVPYNELGRKEKPINYHSMLYT